MSGWDGAGTFTRAYDWTNERDAGNNIDATKFDAENDAFESGINACLAKNGENAATNDLPMGGNRHTGVADATALDHYPSVKQVQGRTFSGGTTGGAANVQTLNLSPALSSYPGTMVIKFTAGFTNTGATTLNINGLGAGDVKLNGSDLIGGEIIVNRSYIVTVNGSLSPTEFDLIGPMPKSSEAMGVSVKRTSAQTVAASTTANIIFDGEDYDPHGLFTATSDQVTLGKIGLWIVTFNMTISSATTTNSVELIKNGTGYFAKVDSSLKNMSVSAGVYAAAATDYIEVSFENSGLSSTDVNPAYLTAAFVG